MKILVTGATGFIGGAIARVSAAQGHETWAITRRAPPPIEGVKWLTASEATSTDMRWDALIHSAAVRHRHGISPSDYVGTNLALTREALDLSAKKAGRFVDISSIAVYGWPTRLPIDESFPNRPEGPYGESKVESERLVQQSGLRWTIVQPSITYGPGDTNGMIDKMLRMAKRRALVGPGLGRSRVQLVYVDDLAECVLAAAQSDKTVGERFICTYRDPIRLSKLIRLLSKAVNVWIPSVGPPVRLLKLGALGFEALERVGIIHGEPPLTREKLATVAVDRAYRIDRLRNLLGREPRVGYEQGIMKTATALGLR